MLRNTHSKLMSNKYTFRLLLYKYGPYGVNFTASMIIVFNYYFVAFVLMTLISINFPTQINR
jgi:hypothetical protein